MSDKPALSTSGQETLEEVPGYTKCSADCGTYTINSHLNEFGLCGDCLLADYRKLRAASSPAVQALESQWQPVLIRYTNYKGETAERRIVPISIYFGSTEWHPKAQWLLEAFDLDRKDNRTFALKDIYWLPAPSKSKSQEE